MRVQRVPQVLHDVLADDVVEVALADADEPRSDRQDDHQPDVEVQSLVVLADDDLVDEQLEQVRVDEPDQARGQDRDEDDRDLRPVRLEEGDDPSQRGATPLLRDRRDLGSATERAPAAAASPTAACACLGAEAREAATAPAHAGIRPFIDSTLPRSR
jgi:hypothetical protein